MNITDEMVDLATKAISDRRDEIIVGTEFIAIDRELALAALSAALSEREPTLDDLLDSLPPQTRIEQFPYYRMDNGKYYCKIVVPLQSRAIRGFAPYYGIGNTRMAAIQSAISHAKDKQP